MADPAPLDDAYLNAAARAANLVIDAEYREGVKRFLVIASEFAAALDEAPVESDHQAHAPVYCPPEF